MKISELDYNYPDELVALKPRRPSRVMWVDCNKIERQPPPDSTPKEITWQNFLDQFTSNDLIVMNNTKVLPSLIVTPDQVEVHMIQKLNDKGTKWEVLFPARDFKIGDQFALTTHHQVTLIQKGLPQVIEFATEWTEKDFFTFGKPALPPYILRLRQQQMDLEEGHRQVDLETNRYQMDHEPRPYLANLGNGLYQKNDEVWYQSVWAEKLGSVAAPTASLHFSAKDIEYLKYKNIPIEYLTLHVGMGTFLPVKAEDLNQHVMHKEFVSIPQRTIQKIEQIKKQGGKVWALGTTVARSLEAYAQNHFQASSDEPSLSDEPTLSDNHYIGHTDLLIHPPYQFQIIDNLLTNFHQPKTTLLALVAAFAGLEKMKSSYQWAIENKFQLFSYGDLSVWTR